MSVTGRYPENDVDNNDGSLSLQAGPALDSLKDLVQSQQIEQHFEADQSKGRKSPAANRVPTRRGSGKMVHTAPHNIKEFDAASDHHSDTTDIEKYMNSVGLLDEFSGEKSDAFMRLASQMTKTDIDKTIAVLLHLRSAVDDPPLPKHSTVAQQTHLHVNQRRSKSGPPGGGNSQAYRHSSSAPSVTQTQAQTLRESPTRGCFTDSRSAGPVEDSDNEEEVEEVCIHNSFERFAIIPPATQKPSFQQNRSESEVSYTTSNASTPIHTSHKRSPTPVSNLMKTAPALEGTEYCPGVARSPTEITKQNPEKKVGKSNTFAETKFSRCPGLMREASNNSYNSNCDDVTVISVASSNSSFTVVTQNSTGGFSKNNR